MLCGYAFLSDLFALKPLSLAEKARTDTKVNKLVATEFGLLVPPKMAPANTVLSHLIFSTKHEGINLEVLSQVLPRLERSDLQAALDAKPSSVPLRKIGCLWENFTGKELIYPKPSGNYTELFDPEKYFTGKDIRIPKWRIIFNGLGSFAYCPVVRKTNTLDDSKVAELFTRLHDTLNALPEELISRTIEWAYLSETRSSFEIERELPSGNKAAQFMTLLKAAASFDALNEDILCGILNKIVPEFHNQAACYRNIQNWLGSRFGPFSATQVTYVPPPPENLDDLMTGLLKVANEEPESINPLIAASVVSFGFVFLHPFLDGNGRLSRFLIHQQLLHHNAVASDKVVPVSAALLQHERQYLHALEAFSAPCRELWNVTKIDDDNYDFRFNGSLSAYRYWDATVQCEFLLAMIREIVDKFFPEEIQFLQRYDKLYRVMNSRFNVIQKDLDVLVASAVSAGRVSKNIQKKYQYKVPDGFFNDLEAELAAVLSED